MDFRGQQLCTQCALPSPSRIRMRQLWPDSSCHGQRLGCACAVCMCACNTCVIYVSWISAHTVAEPEWFVPRAAGRRRTFSGRVGRDAVQASAPHPRQPPGSMRQVKRLVRGLKSRRPPLARSLQLWLPWCGTERRVSAAKVVAGVGPVGTLLRFACAEAAHLCMGGGHLCY